MGVIIRQSIKGTIATYIGVAIGFVSTMFIVAKFLSPEEIGLTRVLLDAATSISALALLGTSSSITKFFPYFKSEQDKYHNGFFFYIVSIPFLGSVLVLSLYLFFSEPIKAFFSQNAELFVEYYYLVIPLAVFSVYHVVFENYAAVLMRVAVPKFIREVLIRLMHIGVYFLYAFKVLSLDGFVMAYVAVFGVAALLNFLYIARIGSVSLRHNFNYVSPQLRREVIHYSLYLFAGSLSTIIIAKIDMFMISAQKGLSEAGVYTIALYMATLIEIPTRSILAIASPLLAAHIKNQDHHAAGRLYKRISLHHFLLGTLIFVVIWVNIDNVFAIIPNGETFKAGKLVVLFLALSRLLDMVFITGNSLMSFSRYYYYTLPFTFLIGILTVVSNNIFIPIWGITGAAVATLLVKAVQYAIMSTLLQVKMKMNPFSINLIKIAVIMGVMLVVNHFLFKFVNPYVDTIFRSAVVGVGFIVLAWLVKASEEMNEWVRKWWGR